MPALPIALIPLRDESDFLRLLHGLQCSTAQINDGFYEVKHAKLTKRLGVRFANQYAYVGIEDLDALKKETLVEPNKVFVPDQNADIRVALRMDRAHKEQRNQAITKLQEAVPTIKARIPRTNPNTLVPTEKLIDLLVRYATSLLEGGRELSLSVRLDSRKEELAADVQFTTVEKSRLALALASMEERASLFGDLKQGSPAFVTRIHFRLPDELRRIMASLAHEALEQTLREDKDREMHKEDERFVRAFEPTVAAGELDLAMFLNSQSRDKPALIVGGSKVVKGLELEKAFRGLVGTLQAPERDHFKLDVGKVAGAALHRLSMHAMLPPQAAALFGPDPFFYFAFRDDALLWSVGESGPDLMKQLLTFPSRNTPVALLELNVKHILDLMPAQIRGIEGESKVLTNANPGRLRLSLGGGTVLRLRVDLSLVQLLAEMGAIQGRIAPQIEIKSR